MIFPLATLTAEKHSLEPDADVGDGEDSQSFVVANLISIMEEREEGQPKSSADNWISSLKIRQASQGVNNTQPVVAPSPNPVAAVPTQVPSAATNSGTAILGTVDASQSASGTSPTPKVTNTSAPTSPLSPPQIAGVVFASLFAIGVFFGILWFFFLRMRRKLQSGYQNVFDADQDDLSYNEAPLDAQSRVRSNISDMTERARGHDLSSPLAGRR
ncbi:hypothetical protein BOTBODRAFT_552271 [Botryobasidium botryosum FD-172 SS1]|uniref:Uncharacterized protein n=1 Tax=Botryobasidium botryosum (strain FD-172 SS1) TaxID=930990 RepID=A0A067MRE6_BOTB1|nr:hypothetical protein BOTBODRAFT_552271 [Botryobasidium botryosum FD-172 SS1]